RFFGSVDYRPGRHPTGRHRAVGRPAAVVVAVPLAREAALEPALPHQRAVERGQPVAVAVARARIAVAVARARIAVARIAVTRIAVTRIAVARRRTLGLAVLGRRDLVSLGSVGARQNQQQDQSRADTSHAAIVTRRPSSIHPRTRTGHPRGPPSPRA